MQKINFNILSIDRILTATDLSKTGSLVEQIYRVLRKNIISLNLSPEMPLVEKEIATIFGISKTPVREALIRLANDRLVTIIPKSGSYVTPISIDRYFEACFVRVSLECSCVKRLAQNGISPAQQVKLKSFIAQQKHILDQNAVQAKNSETIDRAPFFAADEAFHRGLFECAGILGAWEILNNSKAELDRVRHLKKMMGIHRSKEVIKEHTNIVEAIINHDPVAAEQTMTYHIGGIDEEINVIAENPQFLQSIEEFNLLINVQRIGRNKRKLPQINPS